MSDAEGQAAATAAMDESHGQQIERMLREETGGEFTVERLIGKGGMALVYLAKEVHLDRKVAIKVLPPELTFGHGVERFKREAKTAAALDHPHIIPIHRIGSGGKLFWYTMKFVEGRSLEDYLKEKNRFSLDHTIQILEPVADALAYAHENQVIHRDIKPANVMLDERDRVTVTDFGIAKALTEATLTASGSVIGTPYYMSPEQGMGKGVSGASDQYSVAVMAYRMLSGQVPFDGESAIDILHKHCKEPPPPLNVLVPNLPRHVYAAIDKALSKNPQDRFSNVTAFVKGLKQLSPEISAEMDTIEMDADPSLQDDISTKVIGISDEHLARLKAESEPDEQMTGDTAGEENKKTPWLILVPVIFLVVAGGVLGGVWLSGRGGGSDQPSGTDPGTQVGQEAAETQPGVQPPAPTTGTVTVTGLPEAGRITVDGTRQADTILVLEPGTYTVGLSAPGQREVQLPLTIAAGSRVAVPFSSAPIETTSGTVAVANLPTGGEIRVDGQVQRGNPFELERGQHTIRLSAPGFRPHETEINVAAGIELTVPFEGQALVAAVSISAARPEVLVGAQVRVTAQPVDGFGNALRRRVSWTSRNESVATVDREGVVRGVAVGTTVITATSEGQSGSATVTVTTPAVRSVEVSPASSAVFEGETLPLIARVVDETGRTLSEQNMRWRSSDRSTATVSNRGVVTGVKAGTATITAHAGGRSGRSVLTVEAVAVAEEVSPQPAPREIEGPEDLFERAAPAGWTMEPNENPAIIALYDHPSLGRIRILRATDNEPEAILGGLRRTLEARMSTLRELSPSEELETASGERVLLQRFLGIEGGGGFDEARYSVVLAAASNHARAIGVVALFTYYADRDQAAADLRELLRSLR